MQNTTKANLPAKSAKTLCLSVALSLSALASAVFPFFESGFALVYGIFLAAVAAVFAACAWGAYINGSAGCISTISAFLCVRQALSAIYAFLLALAAVLIAILLIMAKAGAILTVLAVAFFIILFLYRVLLFSYYRRARTALSTKEESPLKTLGMFALAAGIASAAGAIAYAIAYIAFSPSVETALKDFELTEALSAAFPGGVLTDSDKINAEASVIDTLFPNFALSAITKFARTGVFFCVYSLTLSPKG